MGGACEKLLDDPVPHALKYRWRTNPHLTCGDDVGTGRQTGISRALHAQVRTRRPSCITSKIGDTRLSNE